MYHTMPPLLLSSVAFIYRQTTSIPFGFKFAHRVGRLWLKISSVSCLLCPICLISTYSAQFRHCITWCHCINDTEFCIVIVMYALQFLTAVRAIQSKFCPNICAHLFVSNAQFLINLECFQICQRTIFNHVLTKFNLWRKSSFGIHIAVCNFLISQRFCLIST